MKRPIPHQTELPGSTVNKRVTIPEVIKEDAMVVLYFIS